MQGVVTPIEESRSRKHVTGVAELEGSGIASEKLRHCKNQGNCEHLWRREVGLLSLFLPPYQWESGSKGEVIHIALQKGKKVPNERGIQSNP